jgi:hypothetical protein
MSFQKCSIYMAIVATQYDLRGFWHPAGFRQKKNESSKSFHATTLNLVAFMSKAACNEKLPSPFKCTHSEYLSLCQKIATNCNLCQKEAVQLIIRDFVSQNKEMRNEVDRGEREESPYLLPLSKKNDWGKVVLALGEAFEVDLKEEEE